MVSIEDSGYYKTVHLADGSSLKAKVNSYLTVPKIRPNENMWFTVIEIILIEFLECEKQFLKVG